VTSAGARPARIADVVIVGGGVTGCSLVKLSPAVGRMVADLITRGRSDLADLHAFRLGRFAATPHDDGGAFSHSYLR
jgi:glycine/D-amino acid oxidase-like deaminating enzyme